MNAAETDVASRERVRSKQQQEKAMKMTHPKPIRTLGAGLILLALAGTAQAYSGEKLASEAKVGIAQARSTALKAHPGKITDEELEREAGGSGLRYSFDIRHGSVTHEVGIDAATGKVLENKTEGPHPD
jgi:uncharacterized membrane protein YkoI